MENPIRQLQSFWKKAHQKKEATADYLSLATIDARRKPHVRTVLIKSLDHRGIGFVCNKKGPKVEQFSKAPVECCLVWPKQHLQVRIAGKIKPMPKAQIKTLWKMRPREAQILYSLGLPQSMPIPSYEFLIREVTKLAIRWRRKKTIPLSPYYTGFIVEPTMVEFLHHNPSRLNKRENFQKRSGGWQKTILAP